ncbi:DegV family protein [Chungangia koreensis]|uniref:DegV family protein n=1 Tax=Chungangia koreensis TaxID=752657 RepID=A0ABV8X299_9LACT
MKTAIVTDSTSYLPKEVRDEWDIHMVPLSVIVGGHAYEEEVNLHVDEFYRLVREGGELPKTSQPPVGQFTELFSRLAKDYDAIISVHLSSGISGTYQGAVQAGQMTEGAKVYAFDSETSCYVQGFYALRAAKMAKQSISAEDIMSELEDLKLSERAYFMADDLSHLQRGGRLSSAQALIGGLLQIKPLLHFENKVIVPFEKIRTRKKAMNRIVELLGEDAAKYEKLEAAIIHANRPLEAEEWRKEMAEKFPNVEFTISYFGPVIGTHLGEGSMGLGWMRK